MVRVNIDTYRFLLERKADLERSMCRVVSFDYVLKSLLNLEGERTEE